MKKVKLKCSGILRKYFPGQSLSIERELDDRISIDDIMRELKIPQNAVTAITVNGKLVKENYIPVDGDEITILPIISGG